MTTLENNLARKTTLVEELADLTLKKWDAVAPTSPQPGYLWPNLNVLIAIHTVILERWGIDPAQNPAPMLGLINVGILHATDRLKFDRQGLPLAKFSRVEGVLQILQTVGEIELRFAEQCNLFTFQFYLANAGGFTAILDKENDWGTSGEFGNNLNPKARQHIALMYWPTAEFATLGKGLKNPIVMSIARGEIGGFAPTQDHGKFTFCRFLRRLSAFVAAVLFPVEKGTGACRQGSDTCNKPRNGLGFGQKSGEVVSKPAKDLGHGEQNSVVPVGSKQDGKV